MTGARPTASATRIQTAFPTTNSTSLSRKGVPGSAAFSGAAAASVAPAGFAVEVPEAAGAAVEGAAGLDGAGRVKGAADEERRDPLGGRDDDRGPGATVDLPSLEDGAWAASAGARRTAARMAARAARRRARDVEAR
jgi:hypothetical protein